MKLTETEHHEPFFDKLADWFGLAIRFILNVLILILTAALLIGVAKAGIDLAHSIHKPLETLLQEVLLDAVFILALLEIAITLLGYLRDGSVHVRYIVDTVLIIMLNEIVSTWFKHPKLEYAISLSVIVSILVAARIALTRLSAKNDS